MRDVLLLSKEKCFLGDLKCELHDRGNEVYDRMHCHDYYQLFICLSGSGIFAADGRRYPVSEGSIAFAGLFMPHRMIPRDENTFACFTAHVNAELLISFSTAGSALLDLFGSSSQPVCRIPDRDFDKYRRLVNEYSSVHLDRGQDVLSKAIVHLLMAYAYNDCYHQARRDLRESRRIDTVTGMVNYINAHLTEPFSLRTMAQELSYSESYLCHLFRQMTGRQITAYIREKRLEKAAGLLISRCPAAQAAGEAGFRSYSYFYRAFRARMGCSPQEYSLRARNGMTQTAMI